MRDLKVLGGSEETTPSPSAVVIKTTTNVWKSPIPYLFGSLAVMLLLISVALLLLIFSYRKRYSSSSSSGEARTGENHNNPTKTVDDGPKIVVIMAGDDAPTYLATPITLADLPPCTCSTATTADHGVDDDDDDAHHGKQGHDLDQAHV
ncbi:protein GLUTAMINE DUMPER 2-like [Humulus lupulus]|uniref:protein GLUTAMINE DUMPER 2-like n=1 Tax=Humulus lupulus TaxID=3486 RepID=UPI002B4022C9|nr:protein GLUTAMINE DUMPER 2-like [Humulus lupulus]